ncbi:MAG: carbohydrate ABC transporter permease [Caldilineaceae bacterium]
MFDKPTLLIKSFYVPNYESVVEPGVPTLLDELGDRGHQQCHPRGDSGVVGHLCALPLEAGGADNIFFWTITQRMAPPAAFVLPLFLLFTRVLRRHVAHVRHAHRPHFALLRLQSALSPFAVWLMKGIIMDGIPIELDEAAYVDGAGRWVVLTRVITPLVAPGLAITFILSWIFAWNEYLFAANLTSVRARTITTGLAEFVSVTGTNWGEMAAVAMVAICRR